MLRGLVTAIRTLTAIRSPGRDTNTLAEALPWFPLVGAMLGVTMSFLARVSLQISGGWVEGAAIVALGASVILTRALHLDGLADWADGFGGSRERNKVLEIMRDPRVGAFGAIALVFVMITKWVAFSRLLSLDAFHWIVSACIVSRAIQVDLAGSLPYARAGDGMARSFVEGARPIHRIVAMSSALAMVAISSGPAGTLILGCGWLAGRMLAGWFRRRVGGITGDLLGASNELLEAGLLFLCAAANHVLAQLTTWRSLGL